jgi:hypothetical protein
VIPLVMRLRRFFGHLFLVTTVLPTIKRRLSGRAGKRKSAPWLGALDKHYFWDRTGTRRPPEHPHQQAGNPMAWAHGPAGVSSAPPFTTQTSPWEGGSECGHCGVRCRPVARRGLTRGFAEGGNRAGGAAPEASADLSSFRRATRCPPLAPHRCGGPPTSSPWCVEPGPCASFP